MGNCENWSDEVVTVVSISIYEIKMFIFATVR